MRKKRCITLIEVMIVIVLIGIIASVVGYNMRGGLDKGKQFKTERGREKLENLLNMLVIEKNYAPLDLINDDPAMISALVRSGHCRSDSEAKELLVDGKGQPYKIEVDAQGYITVTVQ